MGKKIRLVLLGLVLVVFGQQCSKVALERYETIDLASKSNNPFLISPPADFPVVRRYVLLVDMSNSMISGPCQNDVEGGILFSTSPAYSVFDPTKGVGSPNDHRADGIDCIVNEMLPIDRSSVSTAFPNININPPQFYQIHPGIDFSAHRIEIVKKWMTDLVNTSTPEMIENTKVMIVPVSGGLSQTALDKALSSALGINSMFGFMDLSDPQIFAIIDWLKQEHARNYALVRSSDVWRYETTSMGTSAPGGLLSPIYETVSKDMRELNKKGLLSYADYDVVYLTDGFLSPKTKTISDVLSFYAPCASCASNPKNCAGLCSSLVQKMRAAWGSPEENDLKQLDFKFGLLQSLPQFFGAGYMRLNFVQLYQERSEKSRPGEKTFFEELVPYFKARNSRFSVWQAKSEKPPFPLLGSYKDSVSYKMSHLFLINPNARVDAQGAVQVDSDGDGLFDFEEVKMATDATISRSNGFCLDSFMAREAYMTRCKAMAQARSCDPTLDSDGDSLNECEETLLGTDPFDFDTDGDSIPDYFEWLYGYNPLGNDEGKDNNGDGCSNLYNFARGFGPMAELTKMSPNVFAEYEVNYLAKEKTNAELAGEVWVESYQVMLRRVPVAEGLAVDPAKQLQLYASRVGPDVEERDMNKISYEEALLSYPTQRYRNSLVGIMRLVDRDDPDRVFWKIFKEEIPVSQMVTQPQMDLSRFKLIRARDRGM